MWGNLMSYLTDSMNTDSGKSRSEITYVPYDVYKYFQDLAEEQEDEIQPT